MLMLLFHVGDNLYALDSSQVVEVIAMVALKKIYHVPEYVAGFFNYHGTIVPVVDLCNLIGGITCRHRFSTRIAMVNYTAKDGRQKRLGLMAERVTETLQRPDIDLKNAAIASDVPYLGQMFMDELGMIQLIYWEHLITEAQHASLLAQGSIETNGASSN